MMTRLPSIPFRFHSEPFRISDSNDEENDSSNLLSDTDSPCESEDDDASLELSPLPRGGGRSPHSLKHALARHLSLMQGGSSHSNLYCKLGEDDEDDHDSVNNMQTTPIKSPTARALYQAFDDDDDDDESLDDKVMTSHAPGSPECHDDYSLNNKPQQPSLLRSPTGVMDEEEAEISLSTIPGSDTIWVKSNDGAQDLHLELNIHHISASGTRLHHRHHAPTRRHRRRGGRRRTASCSRMQT